MSNGNHKIQPIMMWTPKARPAANAELAEAARQRDEMRLQIEQFERERAEREQRAKENKK